MQFNLMQLSVPLSCSCSRQRLSPCCPTFLQDFRCRKPFLTTSRSNKGKGSQRHYINICTLDIIVLGEIFCRVAVRLGSFGMTPLA